MVSQFTSTRANLHPHGLYVSCTHAPPCRLRFPANLASWSAGSVSSILSALSLIRFARAARAWAESAMSGALGADACTAGV
jgi:hypothetical protein